MPTSSNDAREKAAQKALGQLITTVLISVPTVALTGLLWPGAFPFPLFHFWKPRFSLREVLGSSWPIFLWGTGVTTLYALFTRNKPSVNRDAEAILFGGTAISIGAGLFEELIFRWLVFYSQIVWYQILNVPLFAFPEWFFLRVSGPIANVFTLHYLEPILFNGSGWFVGAAILSSNGKFRSGHAYQGFLGFVNSWFIGMFLFYVMFQYGLFAAMLVHFLYDAFVFVVRYVDAAIERRLGWI